MMQNKNEKMKIIGMTGGVGTGKSTVLDYLAEKYNARVIKSDLVGHQVMEPDGICYRAVIDLFGENAVKSDKTIDRTFISDIVFGDDLMLQKLNAIIHPAVKKTIKDELKREEEAGRKLAVVESALLLQDHYEEFCDEVWFVSTMQEIRIERLMASRGYSREKALGIIAAQASDDFFFSHADRVIYNNDDLSWTFLQLDEGVEAL